MPIPHPTPPHTRRHLCAQADTDSRRRWLESGRLRCPWGGKVDPDTRPHPPHSAAPQSLEGRHSGNLQVWGCRSHGCDRAGIDKRQVPLSSSVHSSLGRTAGKEGQTGNREASPSQHCRGPSSRESANPHLPVQQCHSTHQPPRPRVA